MNFNYIPNFILMSNLSKPLEDSDWSPMSAISMIGQLIFLILVFAGVIILAYYSTKWVASAKTSRRSGNLNVIESMSVGHQGAVQIIRAGKKYFLIGITKEKVTLLSEIDENDIEIMENKPQIINASFERYFKKYFDKMKNLKEPRYAEDQDDDKRRYN